MIHKMTQIHDWQPEGGSVRRPGTYAKRIFTVILYCYSTIQHDRFYLVPSNRVPMTAMGLDSLSQSKRRIAK